MKNHTFSKLLGLTLGLSILVGTAVADSQVNNPFLSSNIHTGIMIAGFQGKPPYTNRNQFRAQQQKARKTAHAEAANLEKTELSALEFDANAKESPANRKSTRKRYGHPSHR